MTKYLLGDMIGRGGMGQVHSSRDALGNPVVVKRLRNTFMGNQSMAERLEDEAKLLERVMHHNVVRAVDRGSDANGAPYLVMTHADGIPLSELIEREGALPVTRAFEITTQVLTGLTAIHEARVVHADMKSSNVLVGEGDRVTIIDFGLARTFTHESREDALAGTPAFMAPEVITGSSPTVAADLYAVGIMLYEMLTGRTPFAASSDIFEAHVREPVVAPSLRAPNRGISLAIDRIVMRTLAKSPADRYQSARELAAALETALSADWTMATVDVSALRTARESPTKDIDNRATLVTARRPVFTVHDQISVALETAGRSIENHAVPAAVNELEKALAAITPRTGEVDPEVWRIETVLAALYDSQGKRDRASRLAISAYKHALRIGCKVAEERTRCLVERLEGKRKPEAVRIARGSGRFERSKLMRRGR